MLPAAVETHGDSRGIAVAAICSLDLWSETNEGTDYCSNRLERTRETVVGTHYRRDGPAVRPGRSRVLGPGVTTHSSRRVGFCGLVEPWALSSVTMTEDTVFASLRPCDRLRLATAYLVLAGAPHVLVRSVTVAPVGARYSSIRESPAQPPFGP